MAYRASEAVDFFIRNKFLVFLQPQRQSAGYMLCAGGLEIAAGQPSAFTKRGRLAETKPKHSALGASELVAFEHILKRLLSKTTVRG